jgi:hypothetical protein
MYLVEVSRRREPDLDDPAIREQRERRVVLRWPIGGAFRADVRH